MRLNAPVSLTCACRTFPNTSLAASHQALHRQQRHGQIIRLSRGSGHWLLVPLQYAGVGAPPLEIWLDPHLSKTLAIPYHVALLSAAEIYGASPYAVMVTQVMVAERRRPVTVGRHKLVFHTSSQIKHMPTRWHETPDGRFKVGTPELTALELTQRASLVGAMARVKEILRALWGVCTPPGLTEALEALQEVPTAQRLGALLTLDDQDALASQVMEWLHGRSLRLIPLEREQRRDKSVRIDTTFKVQLPIDGRRANT